MKLRTGDRRFSNAVCGRKSPEGRGFTHGCGEKEGVAESSEFNFKIRG